jgi:hypothetical protein
MSKILIGCDPELFLKNPNNDFYVSAHGRIQGDKRFPLKVNNGAVQVDGTALEFNIDPAKSREEFVGNVTSVWGQLCDMVPGYRVVPDSVAVYEEAYFANLPNQVKELGCDPDYDGWTGRVNKKPDCNLPMRTAAGHIHIGWGEDFDIYSEKHFDLCCDLAQHLDYYLGIYSLLWDRDDQRRQMYGGPGCFRPKPYGIEYRTLSNAWLRSIDLMEWVYDAAVEGVTSFLNGGFKPVEEHGDLARSIIQSNQIYWPLTYKNLRVPGLDTWPIAKAA